MKNDDETAKSGYIFHIMRVGLSCHCRQAYIFFVFLALGACGKKAGEIPVVPPPTPPLSRPVVGYGVVNVSYTLVVERPGEGEASLGYLRRGALVKVIERRVLKKNETAERWVLAEGIASPGQSRGWLKESVVDIYGNEFQAKTAAESMTQ
ncbi:MAG: hypothetical protein LBG10_02025 [Treponema sp.]|jgi:hypothetical protein|nr:hypothetical protein [Treponema sp.]